MNGQTSPAALLEELQARVTDLQRLLEAEHEALSRHDPEHLETVVRDKERVVDAVNALTRELEDHTRIGGDGRPPEPTDPAWDRLRTLLRGCERDNQRNALLVRRLQWSTHQALEVLGRVPGDAATYRASGGLQGAEKRRDLGRA